MPDQGSRCAARVLEQLAQTVQVSSTEIHDEVVADKRRSTPIAGRITGQRIPISQCDNANDV